MTPIDMVDGRLPLPLGGGAGVAIPPTDVDVQIENLPFWLAIDKTAPYQRQTAQYKKEQSDQQPLAGEQTLASWWLRSQMSFHYGAGQRYLDTEIGNDPIARSRFRDCRGVDVWTPGVVRRLNGTLLADATTDSGKAWVHTALVAGTEWLITAHGTTVRSYNGTTWTTLTYGSSQPVLGFCVDGTNYYALTVDGIYKGAITGGAGTKIYAVSGSPTSGALGWAKDRLMGAINNIIYALDCNAAGGSALPTMTYTHPNAAWQFVCFAETPNGIAIAGKGGLLSTLMEIKLTTTGPSPVLNSAITLLTMPEGELINDAYLHIGSMMILATTRGVRVSTFQSYFGTVTLGPNVVLAGDGVALNCTSLAAYDRFVFAGTKFDGLPALMRVDLSSIMDQQGHYPWAPDLLCPAGSSPGAGSTVTAIAVRQDGTKWFAATGYGIVGEESAPDLALPAWLQTSRIRLGTVEDKHWVHAVVRGVLSPTTPITVQTQGPADAGTWATAYSAQVNADPFGLATTKGEWIALRFTLTGANELNSYQVQALPGGKRQRIISLPLSIVDYQGTRSGTTVGYDGWAIARLAALEGIEQSGAIVTVSAPALFPEAVRGVIEQITYVQEQDPGDRGMGTGGRIVVQLRTTQ